MPLRDVLHVVARDALHNQAGKLRMGDDHGERLGHQRVEADAQELRTKWAGLGGEQGLNSGRL